MLACRTFAYHSTAVLWLWGTPLPSWYAKPTSTMPSPLQVQGRAGRQVGVSSKRTSAGKQQEAGRGKEGGVCGVTAL